MTAVESPFNCSATQSPTAGKVETRGGRVPQPAGHLGVALSLDTENRVAIPMFFRDPRRDEPGVTMRLETLFERCLPSQSMEVEFDTHDDCTSDSR